MKYSDTQRFSLMTAQNVTGAENKLVLLLRYPESRDANFFLSTCTVIEKFLIQDILVCFSIMTNEKIFNERKFAF